MSHQRDYFRVLHGNNREELRKLKPASVHTAIQSPPYYSVRDYGTPDLHWPKMRFCPAIGLPLITVPEWTGQMGLEPNPWHFIGHLVETFRAVRRVLRDDGTLWVNMGDTYHTAAGPAKSAGGGRQGATGARKLGRHEVPNRIGIEGYQEKDLMGIPWMLAKALQADGWILRSEVIWHKPNPMPGSQGDRPTTTHEQVFLFSKRPIYFYDSFAVREEAVYPAGTRGAKGSAARAGTAGVNSRPPEYKVYDGKRERRTVWEIATEGAAGIKAEGDQRHYATFPRELVRPMIKASTSERGACPHCGAPWTRIIEEVRLPVPDAPPPAPVLFGDPEPVPTYLEKKTVGWRPTCVCGADPAWQMQPRDLEYFETPTGEQLGEDLTLEMGRGAAKRFEKVDTGKRLITRYEHRKYAEQLRDSPHRGEMEAEALPRGADAFEHYLRTDDHGARPIPPDLLESWISKCWLREVRVPSWEYPTPVPCVVLDIYGGTATTAEVAIQEGRHAIVCELADHYLPLIERRMSAVTPPLPIVREPWRPFDQTL